MTWSCHLLAMIRAKKRPKEILSIRIVTMYVASLATTHCDN